MDNRPYFLTVEGIEGVGKSSAVQMVCRFLEERGIAYVCTREPGGTQIAEAIRQLLLNTYPEKMDVDTELLLLFASRAQHIAEVIRPALIAGKWVVCDRFTDASYAYQGGGRGINIQRIAVLEQWVQEDLQPDFTFLLDAPVEVALKRIQKRARDRIEQETSDFFQKVRLAYLDRAKQYPDRYRWVDASGSLEDVRLQLNPLLSEIVRSHSR